MDTDRPEGQSPESPEIRPRVVPVETVPAFAREMSERKADWQLVAYGHTVHGFTKPSANQPEIGALYDAKADRRSWQALASFLAELFADANERTAPR